MGRKAPPPPPPLADDLRRLALEKYLHRHAHRGGGPGFGLPFGGGRGRARRGDVRIAVLLLLDEQPRNGYQLMQAIEERSEGRWRPSPGSVYPALAQLEDQGLVRATELDGARVFEITDAGREHVESRAAAHPPWDGDPDPEGEAFGDIRKLLGQVAVAAMQVTQAGDQNQLERAGTVLADTRRALYRILAEEDDD